MRWRSAASTRRQSKPPPPQSLRQQLAELATRSYTPLLVVSVQCHKACCTGLVHLAMPSTILTGGEDAHMYIWTPMGNCITYLSRTTPADYALKFPTWPGAKVGRSAGRQIASQPFRSVFQKRIQRALQKWTPERAAFEEARLAYNDVPCPWGEVAPSVCP